MKAKCLAIFFIVSATMLSAFAGGCDHFKGFTPKKLEIVDAYVARVLDKEAELARHFIDRFFLLDCGTCFDGGGYVSYAYDAINTGKRITLSSVQSDLAGCFEELQNNNNLVSNSEVLSAYSGSLCIHFEGLGHDNLDTLYYYVVRTLSRNARVVEHLFEAYFGKPDLFYIYDHPYTEANKGLGLAGISISNLVKSEIGGCLSRLR